MKVALARAMLMKADIYMLDEPTNHLDVDNGMFDRIYMYICVYVCMYVCIFACMRA